MHKRSKLLIFLIILSSVLLLGAVAAGSYYFGLQHQKWEVEVLQNERAILIHQAAQNSSQDQKEMNKTQNDYDSACFEYQELYAEYTKLYEKTGGSGLTRYTAPDSARDNPDSCYH